MRSRLVAESGCRYSRSSSQIVEEGGKITSPTNSYEGGGGQILFRQMIFGEKIPRPPFSHLTYPIVPKDQKCNFNLYEAQGGPVRYRHSTSILARRIVYRECYAPSRLGVKIRNPRLTPDLPYSKNKIPSPPQMHI